MNTERPQGANPDKRRLAADVAAAAAKAAKFRSERRLAFFKPYPTQDRFFELGATKRERLFLAGNRCGKSESACFELVCHLTGQYPSWWRGRRFAHPVKAWASGETSFLVRDILQAKLCGEPGVEAAKGTGLIPRDCLLDVSLARGIPDAYDSLQVKHASGGVSILRFKAYAAGREAFQGEALDFFVNDEEPPADVYGEVVARLNQGACGITTFTPLKGRSRVVLMFLEEGSPDRAYVSMALSEAEHFTDEEKQKRVAGYAAHERAARESGVPLQGSGAVYPFDLAVILEDAPRDVPTQWRRIWGIDPGIGHPAGFALALIDDDSCIHITHAFRLKDEIPVVHAARMKEICAGAPVAWPHDANARERGSGEPLANLYRKAALKMLPTHAQFETGGYNREAIVAEITQLCRLGKFKIARHLSDLLQEWQLFHRKDGVIVAVEDDILSAVEKCVLAKKHARPAALGSKLPNPHAHGVWVEDRSTGRRVQVADGTQNESYFGM